MRTYTPVVLYCVVLCCVSCPRYDAVTTAGQLRWQNGLTPLNAPFFDLSGEVNPSPHEPLGPLWVTRCAGPVTWGGCRHLGMATWLCCK
jgi:hypothetical protein